MRVCALARRVYRAALFLALCVVVAPAWRSRGRGATSSPTVARGPREGVDAVDLLAVVKGRYRKLSAERHTDHGGQPGESEAINAAMEAAEQELSRG